MSNFITDCIEGDALLTEIDDYIDQWHGGDTTIPLHTFLGMTQNEYELFVTDQAYLGIIVKAHKENKNISIIMREQISMAARSDDQSKLERIKRWLIKEGLWE